MQARPASTANCIIPQIEKFSLEETHAPPRLRTHPPTRLPASATMLGERGYAGRARARAGPLVRTKETQAKRSAPRTRVPTPRLQRPEAHRAETPPPVCGPARRARARVPLERPPRGSEGHRDENQKLRDGCSAKASPVVGCGASPAVGCGGAIGSERFGRRRRRRRRGSHRPPHRPMPVALCSILARGDCESDGGPPAVWTGRARGARRSGRPTSSGPSCGTRSCPATSATGIPILPSLQFLYGPLPVVLVWPVPGGVSFSGWAGARGRGGAGCRKTCASEGGADRTKHCPGRSLAHRRCLCLESNPCWRPIRVVQHRFPIELLNTSNFCFWSYSCKLVTSVVLFDKNTHFRAIHRGYHQ